VCHALFTAMGLPACKSVTFATPAHTAVGPREADWIRWTGVFVGMIGTGVVAPEALKLIGLQAVGRVDRFLERLYLGKQSAPAVVYGSAALIATAAITGELTVTPSPDAPPSVLFAYLMREMDTLRDRIREQERKQRADHEVLTGRMDRRDAEDRAARDALNRQVEEDRRQDTRLNAKGLPLIALGILLAGVPDGLAVVPWVGWIFVVVSALLACWLGGWPFSQWFYRKLRTPSARG
jgi:hypothetical protein